ncbi:MAG: aminotransferase class III-fold pyridoxal phosphate-dependent enzyme [Acidimicrobiia bacterium]|nr:aminotransferase class III-fold pyridoxal phosphate-dependent enzyme [Acidimicrobiia bacterium]
MTSEQARLGVAHYPFIPGPAPLMVVRTEGSHLITDDGRRVLDAGGGAIVANIGHGRPEVAEVAGRSLGEVDYVLPPWATPARVALRDRLVRSWLPEGLTQVGFLSGGSESTDSAIRLAHAHQRCAGRPGKWKVIGRWPSYHGVTLAGLAAGGHAGRRAGYDALLLDFPHIPWDDADALEAMIEAQGPDTVAAFIAEPVIGASGGALVPEDDYFPRVAEICARYDVLFIADEVMTGFGRTGRNFAVDHWGVVPDILVGGKGMAGGYAAMGGIYAKPSVTEPIAATAHNFMFFTFGAQSAHCAVADTVLEIMEREDLVERSAKVGASLKERLADRLGDHPHVAAVRGLGLMLGLELVRQREPHTWFPPGFAAAVAAEALARGVWVYPCGGGDPVQDALLLGPPFTIRDDELDTLVDVLPQAIDAAAAAAS